MSMGRECKWVYLHPPGTISSQPNSNFNGKGLIFFYIGY